MKTLSQTLVLTLVLGATVACEPASILEARRQLARGPARVVSLNFSLLSDTLRGGDLLEDSLATTTPSGLVGVELATDPVNVALGEELEFNGVVFDQFALSVPPAVLAQPAGTVIPIDTLYFSLIGEDRLQAVDTIEADAGSVLTITTSNRLPETLSYSVVLSGFLDPQGGLVTRNGTIAPAAGDGSYTTEDVVIDLTGVKIVPVGAEVSISGSVTLSGNPINPVVADSAVIQTGTGNLVVRSLYGSLDPARTPELTVAVEDIEVLDAGEVDFDDLNDAIRNATLNDAAAQVVVTNQSQAPITLSSYTLGAVRLDPAGQIRRLPNGSPDYEQDTGGQPILVSVVGGTGAPLQIARSPTVTTTTLDVAPLVDRLVNLQLDGVPVAVVGAGTATIGDGQPARIDRADSISVDLGFVVGLDITLPDTGVVFTITKEQDGADLGSPDADDIASRVDTLVATASVTNGTPFEVAVQLSLFPLRQGPSGDVVIVSEGVTLDPVVMTGASVDAGGNVTSPTSSSVSVRLVGEEARVLLENRLSIDLSLRLTPSSSGGRAVLRATDVIVVDARASVGLRAGGAQ